jgi:hypothetical protein
MFIVITKFTELFITLNTFKNSLIEFAKTTNLKTIDIHFSNIFKSLIQKLMLHFYKL